ncbi:trigger factor [Candidatus Oscillochloris fontis]|uniref:trigger factor n=1 Tax=Candidatus Oscillochloris fontis TaxID=2496868 RepID=UPI00101C46A5|nr:trigger factor [Candidatus Oscillochloris fontis]
MKVTTEKLPKSLLALEIEIDPDQVERGLDKAARRLSQKFPIRGFRPGKAPRSIIERSYGRAALMEEATDDLINKAYRDALEQEKIAPVGPPNLESITSSEPFIFRVTVPVAPTVTLGDYRGIRLDLEAASISEKDIERELERMREKHVVLKELDELRPAQEGDQISVILDTEFEDDDEEDEEDDDDRDDDEDDDLEDDEDDADDQDDEDDEDDADDDEEIQTLDLIPGRLVEELHQGLIGLSVNEYTEITAVMPDDHQEESVRGKTITFKVKLKGIRERILPEWDELPGLENFEGSLDDLRAKTQSNLEQTARTNAERTLVETYVSQLVEMTEFDIPDVMVQELAHEMLHEQGHQFERYGITLEQMLEYRGQTHDEAVEALMPDAEQRTKTTLALSRLVEHEGIGGIVPEDVEAQIELIASDYDEAQRPNVINALRTQMIHDVVNMVIDRKLRARIVEIATGTAPALEAPAAEPTAEAPALEAPAAEPTTEAPAEPTTTEKE